MKTPFFGPCFFASILSTVLIAVSVSVSVGASSNLPTTVAEKVNRLSTNDRMIYYSSVAMCERGTTRDYAEKVNIWTKSYQSSGIFGALRVGRSPLRPSPEFEALTSSLGFYLSLEKCFGNDRVARDLFFVTLLSLDISGKFTSWVVDLTMLESIFSGISGATAAGVTTLPARWHWFRAMFNTVWSQPLFLNVTVNHLFVAAFTASSATDLYLEYAKSRDKALIASGNTREKIEILEEENANFKAKIANTTVKEVIDLYRIFIRQNERAISDIREAQKLKRIPS